MANADIEVLSAVYRNAKTGEQAVADVMPMAYDRRFASELESQCGKYTSIGQEAASKLIELGERPREPGVVQKAGMKMGVVMNTATRDDTGRLAELMIKGSSMGIIDLTRAVNTYTAAAPETLGLAQKLITAEHDNIDRLKSFLKQ